MRKSGKTHSEGNKNRRKFFFAVIFMLIIFSLCSCGEATKTVPSDLEEEIPEKEETEAGNFSEDIQVYSEDDQQAMDSMADTGKENGVASDGQINEDIAASVNQSEENATASDNRTKEDSSMAESQINDTHAISEGLEISKESAGEIVEEPVAVFAGTDYILNMNTKKFHYPDCSSVGQMAEKNKWAYTGNRDDVIAMGYVPCKRCNP